MTAPLPPTVFKSHFLAKNGNARFGSVRVTLDDTLFHLDDFSIDYGEIQEALRGHHRLILGMKTTAFPEKFRKKAISSEADYTVVGFSVPENQLREVKERIDRNRSARQLLALRTKLEKEGKLGEFRALPCPGCGSAINLTGSVATLYLYCPYCASLYSGSQPVSSGWEYDVCDECGFYGRIQYYTEFFFYFLLVVYGYTYRVRKMCATCAHQKFPGLLLKNLLFVIGIVPALLLKRKAGKGHHPDYLALTEANRLAEDGQAEAAAKHYQEIYRKHPEHPAVLRNEAIGWFTAGNPKKAAELGKRALAACANYLPAAQLLANLQRATEKAGGKEETEEEAFSS